MLSNSSQSERFTLKVRRGADETIWHGLRILRFRRRCIVARDLRDVEICVNWGQNDMASLEQERPSA